MSGLDAKLESSSFVKIKSLGNEGSIDPLESQLVIFQNWRGIFKSVFHWNIKCVVYRPNTTCQQTLTNL
jgi:hypothetical protein